MKQIYKIYEDKYELINSETREIYDRFLIDMSMRNLASSTQESYKYDLLNWFTYILEEQGNKPITKINDDDITAFLYHCKNEGNNSERIKRRTAVISSIFKFMRKKRIIVENPVEFIDRPKRGLRIRKQTYLTSEQVALMREKLIELNNIQLRLYASLSLSTMARRAAIARITWNQIDLEKKIINGVLEKEGKIVDLFFSDEVKYLLILLKKQREEKGIDDYGYLWRSGRNKNKPISPYTLNGWAKRIGKLINIPSMHPHDFRHSGATLLKNAGMNLEDVSVLLSHESTDTTKKYYIKEDTNRISSIKQVYNI